jgi:hypothetical protein
MQRPIMFLMHCSPTHYLNMHEAATVYHFGHASCSLPTMALLPQLIL